MSKTKTPVDVVTGIFGVRPLARSLNVSPSAIVRWRHNNDGQIPMIWQRSILTLAKQSGVQLTEKTLIWGA